MRRLAVVPAGLLILAGCASEDTVPPRPSPLAAVSPSATTSAGGSAPRDVEPDAPTTAYLSWLDALASRDAALACTIQHPELTIALRREAILLGRASLGDPCVGFEALLWEDPVREPVPDSVETTLLSDEKATLAVTFPDSLVTVELELQRAAWRVLSESRRTSGDGSTARWLASWCDLSTGSTREAVVGLMGEPSGTYSVENGGEPQLYWAADQYDFRAYLDPVDDTVTDLVSDYDALSAEDREQLGCPELR